MNRFKNIFFFVSVLIVYCSPSVSQVNRLKIGDQAPSLSALKWIKGAPIEKLKEGQVYVVEFGATWCKPCIAAIPHMSALNQKYGKDLDLISFFIMEGREGEEDPQKSILFKRVGKSRKKARR